MKLAEFGEDQFLRELQGRFPSRKDVPVGVGDDAAALALPEGENVLLTADTLVERVHFTRQTLPPRFLGRKAVAVSGSDIAAMGGEVLGALLSLAVPGDTEVETLWQIVDGAAERAEELGMSLIGGNLSRCDGPIVVDVTVAGRTLGGRLIKRSGARSGDAVYVSGKIGSAAEGFKLLEEGIALSPVGGIVTPEHLRMGPLALAEACIRAHMDPEPRLLLGKELNARKAATACIDISDGLALDLHRLCRASGVGARIEEISLPLSPGLLAWEREWGRDPLQLALAGGEDYELLFTVRNEKKVEALRRKSKIAVTRIGALTSAAGVELVRRDGSAELLDDSGWDHFRVE